MRRVGCGIALLLGTASLPAQQAPPSADKAVFRAGVDVVRLDIQVTDDSGKPITDLRPDEVQVVDSGTREPVVLFQHISPAGRTKLEAEQRTVAGEISTNQGAPRGQLYVLVFDQDHITSGAEQKVREAADNFLRHRFRPGEDRVAVFGLPGPGPSLPFTQDVSKAIAQLALVRGGLQRTLTPGERDMTVDEAYEILRGNQNVVERFMTNQNGASNRTGVLPDITGKAGGDDADTLRKLITDQANLTVQSADAVSRRFLDMMSQVLRTFRDLDGRKTVILFSEGFHEDNISPTIKDVAAAAAETYSVIYAFDLNRRTDTLTSVVPAGGDIASEITNRLDSMSTLANDTNGQLIRDASTHLDEALAALGEAEVDYYVIGFPAPDAALSDRGDYRHVTVRVDRPGAHVHTRTGYVASAAPTAADRRRAVETALTAPFAQQGLRVEYTTYVGQSDHPGLQAIAVSLAAELPIAPSGRDASADVVFLVMDRRTGQIVARGSDVIPLPHEAAPGYTSGQGIWRTRFELPAGEYTMRAVVREPGGLLGSAFRQFSVRSLNGPDPAASDLVLGTPTEHLPVRTVAYANELLAGAVRVYGRSEAQLAGLTASLDLIGLANVADAEAGRPARTVAGTIEETHATAQGVARDVTFGVPLADLPAGEYVAHVTIRSNGDVVADLRRQVAVVAGARPAPVEAAAPDRPAGLSVSSSPQPRDILKGNVVKEIVDQAARSGLPAVRQAATEASGGRWPRALAALAPAPTTDPDAGRLRGLARIDSGDFAGAVSDLGSTFDAQPTDARLAFVLGWAQIGAGNQIAAASAFRSAAFLDPTLVPAHLALAETYLRLSQPALAAQALEAGLAKLPQSPELKRMLETIKK